MTKKSTSAGIPGSGVHRLGNKPVPGDPFLQFSRWFREAVRTGNPEPGAVHLSTCGKRGRPSGRMVLLKGLDPSGFVFFTNYGSRKGKEIQGNPLVALTFFWPELERQVRIEGKAKKISSAESDRYFSSRPAESRISAIVSPQSHVISGRESLRKQWKQLMEKTGGKGFTRPPGWGGYRVVPYRFEFWQGREHRLHDRIVFRKLRDKWILERLAP